MRSSVICSDANLPRVEYEDIVSGAGRLNKDIYAKQSSKSGIAFHRGDVLYGKLRPYLQDWLLPTFDGLAVGDFWVLQPQNADSSFLYRLIQSRQFDEVANQSTGTKMPRADWKLVSKTVFSIPSNISEQAAIGTYFTALDNLITLHQREFAFLCKEKSKKFRYIKNAWEQRKLGDVVDVRSGKDYKHLSEGNIPVYGTGGFMLSVNQALSYDEDAIGIGRKGTIDKPYILKAPFWTVDTLFYAIPREKVDLNFAFDVFQNIDWKKKDESTGVPSLSKTAINEIDVLVPQYDEQQPLGQFFNRIDNLITLHQCKCQIDGCRFQSPLAITWEQRKFGEVFDCTVPNNTLSRAELSYDEGTVLNVHYGDVLIKYGSVLDVQKDDIPRIPHRCREDFNGALLQDGDVIIADTAEDETTGKACEIGNLQGSAIVSGLHTMVCRPRNRMALGYLGYYLNSNAYHYQLLPLMQGIKVLSLSRSNIQKTSVSYPSAMKEQQLIASYFSQLDHLITLHQCE